VPSGVKKLSVPLSDLERLAKEGKLYAVFDACGSPPIQVKIGSLGPEAVLCLYRTKDEDLLKTAPYVAKVDRELLTWLVDNVWEEPWGIFLAATADLPTLHRHLRKFLVVKDPEDEVVYFRYYDPRVLPAFLSACNDEELKEFFGPILALGVNGQGQKEILLLQRFF
jgi:hypothetical protein